MKLHEIQQGLETLGVFEELKKLKEIREPLIIGGGAQTNWGDIVGDIEDQTDLQDEFVNVTGDSMTGALNMTDNPIQDVGFLDFNLVNGIAQAEGRMVWNDDEGTLNLGMKGGVVNLQIGQESLVRGKNTSGTTITNGMAVRITGATGANPNFGLSDADNPAQAGSIGLATEDIVNNQFGYVTTQGLVRGLDTSGTPVGETWAAGDRLFVSNDEGELTNIQPTATERIIFIGLVTRKHASEGVIWVSPINVSYIEELSGNRDGSGNVLLNIDSVNGRVGIGTDSPLGLLHSIGKADEVQQIIQAYSTQTNNILEIQDSGNNVLAGVQGRGTYFSDLGSDPTNLFIGVNAGNSTTTGQWNSGIGENCLSSLTTGNQNFCLGFNVGNAITSGFSNTAIGSNALITCSTGIGNVAVGNTALSMSNGVGNMGLGFASGWRLTTGGFNVIIGPYAGSRQTDNSQLLIIDASGGAGRASVAEEEANSILYGQMDASVVNQTLRLNAEVTIPQDLIFEGDDSGLQFTQIYEEDGTSTVALPLQDTFYQVTAFSVNGEVNGMVPDHTSDHITVTKTGKYLVSISIGFSQTTAVSIEYDFHVQKNDGAVDFPCISAHRNSGGASQVGNTATTGIIDLTAGDTVELWVERLDGAAVSRTITIATCSLVLVQIGG